MKNVNVIKPKIESFGNMQKILQNCASRITFVEKNVDIVADWIISEYGRRGAKCLSVDVFDTLLLRNGEPEALRFLRMAAVIAEIVRNEKLPSEVKRRSSRELTIGSVKLTKDVCAAFLARATATEISYRTRTKVEGCREGHIDDILKVQAQILGLDPSHVESLKNIELDIEAKNLVGNLAIAKACQHVKSSGGIVIALSDMYLDAASIGILIETCFAGAVHIDQIFSSADLVVSKHSKKIFPKIEEKLGLDAASFLHIGDSHASDVINPFEAGWAGLHFPVATEEYNSRKVLLFNMIQLFLKLGVDIKSFAKV